MARQASISRIITYAHIPRTPVLDNSGKWTYQANPSSTLLDATVEKLNQNDVKVTEAQAKAQEAQQTAASAQAVAASKATAEEAVEEVRGTIFKAYDTDGNELDADRLEFRETEDGWKVSFCITKPPVTAGGLPVGSCQVLCYPSLSDFRALQERVTALERKVGK